MLILQYLIHKLYFYVCPESSMPVKILIAT